MSWHQAPSPPLPASNYALQWTHCESAFNYEVLVWNATWKIQSILQCHLILFSISLLYFPRNKFKSVCAVIESDFLTWNASPNVLVSCLFLLYWVILRCWFIYLFYVGGNDITWMILHGRCWTGRLCKERIKRYLNALAQCSAWNKWDN